MAVKQPTGCTITRNGNTFTMSWTRGETYSHQVLRWRDSTMPTDEWNQPSIGAGATSYSITIDPTKYSPYTDKKLERLVFRIRGFKNGWNSKSEVGWYTWRAAAPPVPSLTAELDSEHSNVTKFTWDVSGLDNSSTDNYAFRHVELQSVLVTNDESDGSKQGWNSNARSWATGAYSSNSSRSFTEDTEPFVSSPYIRWVRVRARGVGADSAWRYAYHVYGTPFQPVIKSCQIKQTLNNAMRCLPIWEAPSSFSRPIDKSIIEYTNVTPLAGLQCPSDASWTEGDTSADTAGNDGATFVVEKNPGNDECFFLRVTAWHDKRFTHSAPFLVAKGTLPKPTGLNVSTNDQTFRATITATNNSTIPDSFMVVEYQTSNNPPVAVAVIPHGETSVTIKCPDWSGEESKAFRVYTVVGSYSARINPTYSVTTSTAEFGISTEMKSDVVTSGGKVPQMPANVSVEPTGIEGTARISWTWTWDEATETELSWADHEDAWESTDEPTKYTVTNLHASYWNISGLSVGITYYFRVRLAKTDEESTVYGPWSDIVSLKLTSTPMTPVLSLSESVITSKQTVKATWAYAANDGSIQRLATICKADVSGANITYGEEVAKALTEQSATIKASDIGSVGDTYYLCVKVFSSYGEESAAWSEPVPITIADPLTASITSSSLKTINVKDDPSSTATRSVLSLTSMPMTVKISGANSDGITSVVIERAQEYYLDRPDENAYTGYDGESIVVFTQDGDGEITITNDMLVGHLDDNCKYRLIGLIKDSLGRSAEVTKEFEVHWSHQAVIPKAKVEVDAINDIVKLTPVKPSGYADGDVCDIYRLSADKPTLIYENAEFGTTYIDPYPTLGFLGGHRLVYKTSDGDYTTSSKELAWLDVGQSDGDILDRFALIIDFEGERAVLPYNISLSNSWSKEFQETKYLGGSVQGDWNNYVSRTASFSTDVAVSLDSDLIRTMRRLAVFSGICHVRTPDGTNILANVDVSESRESQWVNKLANFSLDITRVDPEELDGILYDDYLGVL